jgi:peptide deformylase
MANSTKIYEIVKYPDPILSKRGEPVTEFDDKLKTLVEDMFESMYAAQGIGLAAPQIGISKRLTVIDISFKKNPEEKIVLINPEIIDRDGKQFEEEGCLSLPEIREKVRRAAQVKVRAHHLDGILFIDHLSRLKRDLVKSRIKKMQKNGEW